MKRTDDTTATDPNGEALSVGRLEREQIEEAAGLFGRAFADERFFRISCEDEAAQPGSTRSFRCSAS